MTNNKFGNLRMRIAGEIAGYPLVGINTMPIVIDDCPVLINFTQAEEASSSALKLSTIEQALLSTYVPATVSASHTTEQKTVPSIRMKHSAAEVDAAEFKQLLAEGVTAFEKENLSVDL